MRKVVLAFAALATLSFAVPYTAPAKAEAIVIRTGHWHPYRGPRVVVRPFRPGVVVRGPVVRHPWRRRGPAVIIR